MNIPYITWTVPVENDDVPITSNEGNMPLSMTDYDRLKGKHLGRW